jgi:Rap1a immunity proteins
MTKTRLAVAILLALTMPASAQTNPPSTANDMLSGCKGLIGGKTPLLKEALGQGRCAGFVAALVYARSVFSCLSEGATPEQGVRIVIKYIEARPKRMQEPFGKLALEALGEAWPCER